MKTIIFTVAMAAGVAMAASKPIVTKTTAGGFMAPEYAGYERCEVFSDKVVITHQMGRLPETELKLVENRKISLKGNVEAVLEKAKIERVEEKPNLLCDGPSTSTVASASEGEEILLYTTGGCGSPRKERMGAFSAKLRNVVDLYCPKTIDFTQHE